MWQSIRPTSPTFSVSSSISHRPSLAITKEIMVNSPFSSILHLHGQNRAKHVRTGPPQGPDDRTRTLRIHQWSTTHPARAWGVFHPGPLLRRGAPCPSCAGATAPHPYQDLEEDMRSEALRGALPVGALVATKSEARWSLRFPPPPRAGERASLVHRCWSEDEGARP